VPQKNQNTERSTGKITTLRSKRAARGSLLVWLDKDMCWHGSASGKRGRSPKYSESEVHLGIDAARLEIRAIEVTDNATGDAPMLPCLLDQIANDEIIASVSGDGAYDTKGCHEAIAQRGAQAIIPTRRNATPWKDQLPGAAARNAILDAMRRLGRAIWKKWTGYHRRSLVETKMRCFKLLGERVMARDFDRQVAELQVRAAILNRFTRLGTPTIVSMP
jgi:hypothetical protein